MSTQPMRPFTICLTAALSVALIASFAAAEPFAPQFDRCTLEIAGRSLTPSGVRDPWGVVREAGARRIVVRDATVESAETKDGRAVWSVASADARKLRWLAASGDVALFCIVPLPEEAGVPEIRRFDVVARTWLAPLRVPADDPKQRLVVVAAIADAGRVVVLTRRYAPGENAREWTPRGWRATLYKVGEDHPAWSYESPAEGARPDPGVRLWADRMPDFAASDLVHLSWLGDGVLVCAGEKDDVVRIDAVRIDAAGKVVWRVPRVWEYQRGFIGPSVWSHYIARFGERRPNEDLERPGTPEHDQAVQGSMKALAPKRAEFDKQFQCAIVGGPVVVRADGQARRDEPDSTRVFVAVAKGPNEWNWGYVSDCVLYELSGEGQVIGMVNLPRMVVPDQFGISGGALVWACAQGTMLRIARSATEGGFSMGPGGPDMICPIEWYKRVEPVRLIGWLTAGKAGDAVAFGESHAFVAVEGGYVRAEAEKIYRFPLSIVELKSGVETRAVLSVPFTGDIPPQRGTGPHLIGVTVLRHDRGTLEVTFGREGSAAGVSFDVGFLSAPVK